MCSVRVASPKARPPPPPPEVPPALCPSPAPLPRTAPQVLLVSDNMNRTESVLDPSLFHFESHFESPWQLVGKTRLSEVRPERVGGRGN